MLDLHIEDFSHDIVKTLLRLFNAFPAKHTVYLDEICGPDRTDEYGIASDRHQRCLGAMLWLESEQLIRIDDVIPNQAIDQSTLTLVCYRALTQMPKGLPIQASFIMQFRNALTSGSSETVKTIAHSFLDYALTLKK